MTTLRISEVFGPTAQGEGPSTGRRAVFVRVSGCNLDCSWCDTPYTWDWHGKNGRVYDPATEMSRHNSEAVASDVLDRLGDAGGIVVFTGGEPMAQQSGLAELALELHAVHPRMTIEVETNGTLPIRDLTGRLIHYNVSPKLAHSGVADEKAWTPAIHDYVRESILGNAIFKFVACDVDDLAEIDKHVQDLGVDPSRVWVMPEGRDPETIQAGLRALVDPVLERGYNLSGRMHVAIWGDRRGV